MAGFRYDRHGIYPSELPDAELASIACPTLVLLGDKEMIYDPTEAAERARRLLPHADVEIESGVGHLVGMQRPEIVNPLVSAFLGDRVSAPVLQPA